MIIYSKELEIGGDGKILLKTWHVYFGYVFATNLLFRFVWAFIGGHYSRWRAFLPSGKGFVQSLVAYVRSLFGGVSKRYIGHNPLARLMISFMFLLMLTQAVTGLILAGTDVYMPPLGSYFAEMVTNGDEEKLAQLKPGSKEFVDPDAYAQMREFRAPIIDIHNYVFYALLITIFMHITAVVLIEVTRRSGIISAMFSGEQWYDGSEDK
jgi:cytochrome b